MMPQDAPSRDAEDESPISPLLPSPPFPPLLPLPAWSRQGGGLTLMPETFDFAVSLQVGVIDAVHWGPHGRCLSKIPLRVFLMLKLPAWQSTAGSAP